MAKKMEILFDGFEDLAYSIDKAGGDLKSAVDEALTETQKIIQYNLQTAAEIYQKKGRKGYATGRMYHSIIDNPKIEWLGTVAEVGVGFNLLYKGGFHSLFVMYGTPRMSKDAKVYNAIRGKRVRDAIAEAQERIMQKHLSLTKGK